MASVNAVAMPMSAMTHIQKIAPGPPSARAIATPAMLPVPTRLARLMQNAWNEEMPSPAFERDPRITRSILPNERNCTARDQIVKRMPANASIGMST